MPTPEEKYYDGMNTLLAPVRAAKSLMQTVLIIVLLLGAGLFYPLIQFCNEGHITFGGFMASALTALFILTFFYTPGYTVVGGIVCFAVVYFYGMFAPQSFAENFNVTGTGFSTFIFIFLAVGILQKYIRNQIAYSRPISPEQQEKNRIFYKSRDDAQHLERMYQECVELARKDGVDFDSLPEDPNWDDTAFSVYCRERRHLHGK